MVVFAGENQTFQAGLCRRAYNLINIKSRRIENIIFRACRDSVIDFSYAYPVI